MPSRTTASVRDIGRARAEVCAVETSIYPAMLGFTSYAQGTGCFQPDEYQRAG
jgi:hypothetical protein